MTSSYFPTRTECKEIARKEKKVAKLLGTCNYTPLISRVLAGVLCALAKRPVEERREILGIFQRVANGGDK